MHPQSYVNVMKNALIGVDDMGAIVSQEPECA